MYAHWAADASRMWVAGTSIIGIHDKRSTITDDTIMTLATAAYLLGKFSSFKQAYQTIGLKYFDDYFGTFFKDWLQGKYKVLWKWLFNASKSLYLFV